MCHGGGLLAFVTGDSIPDAFEASRRPSNRVTFLAKLGRNQKQPTVGQFYRQPDV